MADHHTGNNLFFYKTYTVVKQNTLCPKCSALKEVKENLNDDVLCLLNTAGLNFMHGLLCLLSKIYFIYFFCVFRELELMMTL